MYLEYYRFDKGPPIEVNGDWPLISLLFRSVEKEDLFWVLIRKVERKIEEKEMFRKQHNFSIYLSVPT